MQRNSNRKSQKLSSLYKMAEKKQVYACPLSRVSVTLAVTDIFLAETCRCLIELEDRT